MTIITHANLQLYLDKLQTEPYFQCGSRTPYDEAAWYNQTAELEVPTGELCEDGLKTLALVGRGEYSTVALTGKEGFNAQGLEGKVVISKPLFNALMAMRDLINPHRGRILWKGGA